MAGIDTQRERSIFEYRPKIERKITKPTYPQDRTPEDPKLAIAPLRFNTLTRAIALDEDLNRLQTLANSQMEELAINVTGPEQAWAVQHLGGNDTINFDLYKKAKNLYRNAALASMCIDPVVLVFAESGKDGLQIPRVKTRAVTCEEAADPNLFQTDVAVIDTIGMTTAMQKFNQMGLYKTLQMTWWGMIIFCLHAILKMVEGGIRAMKTKWNPVKLAIGRFLKKIARLLRRLICWAEKRIFGYTLSGFCKKETTKDKSGDIDDPVTAGDRTLCFELNAEDREEYEQDKECLDMEEREDSPEGEGCPVFIPPECIKAAHIVVNATVDWALDNDNPFGNVNPAAILLDNAIDRVIDVHESGKFLLVSNDNSSLSDKLSDATTARPEQKNRWQHPMVKEYVAQNRPKRVEYEASPSSDIPVSERTRDCARD